jgi:hypothetical protein
MTKGLDEFSDLFAKKYGGGGMPSAERDEEAADIGGFFRPNTAHLLNPRNQNSSRRKGAALSLLPNVLLALA